VTYKRVSKPNLQLLKEVMFSCKSSWAELLYYATILVGPLHPPLQMICGTAPGATDRDKKLVEELGRQ
jgi:hypothetical protein